MRKRYFTSHFKLPTLIICFCFCTFIVAKENEAKDTNIICYAVQSRWICAAENQKELANKESKRLIQKNHTKTNTSDVVIKQINIPKFNSSPEKLPKKYKNNNLSLVNKNTNPYKNLWSYQLIGVSTSQSAINFTEKNHLNKNDVLIIKSEHKNMDWWIVLYGLYKDKETGISDRFNIPNSIHKYWLRPLKNLVINGYIDKF